MVSAEAAIWLPDTQRFFMELSTMTTRAQQQRNTTATVMSLRTQTARKFDP